MSIDGTIAGDLSKTNRLSGSLVADKTLSGKLTQSSSPSLAGSLTIPTVVDGHRIYYDTTEHWNMQIDLIAKEGTIYIYSDHESLEEDSVTKYVPGIKIGDGTSYLIDMPFVGDAMSQQLIEHIANMTMHVTDAERNFWNNKVTADITNENLILTKGFIGG